MDPAEGGDLERVFHICDADNDGLVTKEELELILQDIGVESADIDEFLWGLQSEYLNINQFREATEKFQYKLSSSSLFQSVNSNRASPRSLAGSALGGDHVDCQFQINELSSRNSVLSKQIFSLEAQIHELSLLHEDQQKHEKMNVKELRKLQARFAEVSAELEAAKQANKDMTNRENELKRSLRELQEQRGDIEDDLHSTRAELESARNSGSNQGPIVKGAPKIHPETQAELDRLAAALERIEAEAQQLRRTNEELMRVNSDDKFHIKILDARIEKLNLELEAKDVLFAELGLVPDKQGGVTDMHGNTWHGFRNVSPLYSELGQIHDQPLHPSLIDARSLPHTDVKEFDSTFLKEKVANVNEVIRRRGMSDGRKRQQIVGSVMSNSDEPGGETDETSFSVSESEDPPIRLDKMAEDQSDLVTNQLMNLSDLVITTSDIAHSNRATPTNIRDERSTPSTRGGSSSPVPSSDLPESSDAQHESDSGESAHATVPTQAQTQLQARAVVDASALPGSAVASPLVRANTPTPTHGFGPSPDEAHHQNELHVHDSPPGTAQAKPIQVPKLHDLPKYQNGKMPLQSQPTTPHSNGPASKSPRTPGVTQPSPRAQNGLQSTPSTLRLDPEANPNFDSQSETPVPLGKRMTLSKSEKIIRQKPDKTPKAEPSPYKPNATKQKPELPRHKSDVSLYNSELLRNPSPSVKKMDSDQVNELQEFALKAGLIRSRAVVPKMDKYAQADPSEFEAGAQIEGKVVTPTNVDSNSTRIQRSRSQPAITPRKTQPSQTTPQRTPHQTPSARVAQHSDRRIVVRGNPYLIRILSYPDPALDEMEEIVKKLEAELDGIEERLNKPPPSSSSSSSSTSSSSTSAPSSSSSTSASSTSSSTTSSVSKRTHKAAPLPSSAQRSATPRTHAQALARSKYWWLAALGTFGCLVLAIVVGITKLQLSRLGK